MSDEPDQGGNARKLSDAEARRILARATEIDAVSAGVSIADLREAAGQAGIASDAFDEALVELRSNAASADPESSKPAPSIRRRLRSMLLETARIAGVVAAILLILMVLVDWLG